MYIPLDIPGRVRLEGWKDPTPTSRSPNMSIWTTHFAAVVPFGGDRPEAENAPADAPGKGFKFELWMLKPAISLYT